MARHDGVRGESCGEGLARRSDLEQRVRPHRDTRSQRGHAEVKYPRTTIDDDANGHTGDTLLAHQRPYHCVDCLANAALRRCDAGTDGQKRRRHQWNDFQHGILFHGRVRHSVCTATATDARRGQYSGSHRKRTKIASMRRDHPPAIVVRAPPPGNTNRACIMGRRSHRSASRLRRRTSHRTHPCGNAGTKASPRRMLRCVPRLRRQNPPRRLFRVTGVPRKLIPWGETGSRCAFALRMQCRRCPRNGKRAVDREHHCAFSTGRCGRKEKPSTREPGDRPAAHTR